MKLQVTLLILLNSLWAAYATAEGVLNVYNWSDYIHPDNLRDFEREYGIQVNYDIYDSSEMVDTKLMTGRSGYDIVIHSASFAARLNPVGAFMPIDYSQLSNWHNIDANIIQAARHDYGGELAGVPYMWGTTGFTYNVDMINERMANAPVTSAALVFDPAVVSRFADCGVSLLDDPTSVIPMAMLYLGFPANSVEPQHLQRVEQLLKSIRPYIKYFSSTKMLMDLPNREVCIAMTWSGDYSVARQRASDVGLDVRLAYHIPSEGSVSWIDAMFIPRDAPHSENAHLFIDYFLRPEVIAKASNYVGYANANTAATALVDQSLTADPAIYPDAEAMQRLHAVPVREPKLERRRSRTWTRFKSGL